MKNAQEIIREAKINLNKPTRKRVKNCIAYRNGYMHVKNNLKRIRVYRYMPKGWKVAIGSLTAPVSTIGITNGKSFLSGKRKFAFLEV
jgi:hypothetical protein